MTRGRLLWAGSLLALLVAIAAQVNLSTAIAQDADKGAKKGADKPEAFLIPRLAGLDYVLQGDYVGDVFIGADQKKRAVQVVALGDGKFHARLYAGGLPGDGWDGNKPEEFDGAADGEFGVFKCSLGTCTIKNAAMTIENADVVIIGTLIHEDRASKTIGMKPPKGAQLLLDSSDPLLTEESLPNWVSVKEGEEPQQDYVAICQGVNSKATFQDCIMHIEFQTSFMPKASGQGRSNSGVYLQGRYEVQVLDSFGLEGKDNECGGIYEIKAPSINMCYPPLAWQTYDIKFTAAKFDADGKKTANARMTVIHNGVKIHDNVEVPRATRAAPNAEGPEPGFLHLQDHGCPVRYRNIWVLDTSKAKQEPPKDAPTEEKPAE
ncbi:MAG: DUF1080 domain-containing protein [Pirellulales bacterium]